MGDDARHWALLEDWLARNGVVAPPGAIGGLKRHWELLLDENRRQNLTSVTDLSEAVVTHYLDSLSLLWSREALGLALPSEGLDVLDAGSGAGFPGVPLGLFRPGWRMTLADSRLKRVRFLEKAIEALGLSDCRAIHCRLEKADPDLRDRFDLVVARALADPIVAVRTTARLVAPGGRLVLYTGQLSDEQLASVRREATRRGLAFRGREVVDLPEKPGHWLAAFARDVA